jgi:hypothetical protein
MWTALRAAFRLIAAATRVRWSAVATVARRAAAVRPSRTITKVTVHRFEQTIGGRAYHIEVRAVSNRWRAQLQRRPGTPTAMMPFYGQTPDEAARQLTDWLTLAHRRLVSSA